MTEGENNNIGHSDDHAHCEGRVEMAGKVTLECTCCKVCHRTLHYRISDCEGNPFDDYWQIYQAIGNAYGFQYIESISLTLLESVGSDTWLVIATVQVDCDRPDDPPCDPRQVA